MLDTAFEALARGDAPAALSAARAAVADQPQRAEAHQALGLALQLGGELDAAALALERAIALAPLRAELHLARASLAIGQQDRATADSAIRAAVNADPNSLGAYLMALHLALGRSQPDEAERQLKLAQRVAPEHPRVLAAAGALALARDSHAEALRLLSKAVLQLPNDPLVLAALGLAYRASGNHAFAEAALIRAIAQQPKAIGLRWALIDSLRRQGREADAQEPLRELLRIEPEDRSALALLGDLSMRRGDVEAALDCYRQLLLLAPFQLAPLDRLLQRMVQAGMAERAVQMLDVVLDRFPQEEILWHRRLQGAQGNPQALESVLSRWQLAQPHSAQLAAALAEFDEWRGNSDAALANARLSLEREPTMLSAEAILLRAELQSDPQAALARIERLDTGSSPQAWQRALCFWRGQALDRCGRQVDALVAWDDAWANTTGGNPLPAAPALANLTAGPTDGPTPRLLWSPPGGRPREVLAMLSRVPGLAILDDRFGAAARADGFGPARSDGGSADRAGWAKLIEPLGVDPARCIDWLPHWDARIAAGLPGATLIAVIADPRDLLLNWLAFASPLPVRFPGAAAAASWLQQTLEPLAQRLDAGDPNLLVIRDSELIDAPQAVAERLQQALALDGLPDVGVLEASRRGMGGLPTVFAPGHWRDYAEPLADAFDALAPLAARLGYPAA